MSSLFRSIADPRREATVRENELRIDRSQRPAAQVQQAAPQPQSRPMFAPVAAPAPDPARPAPPPEGQTMLGAIEDIARQSRVPVNVLLATAGMRDCRTWQTSSPWQMRMPRGSLPTSPMESG